MEIRTLSARRRSFNTRCCARAPRAAYSTMGDESKVTRQARSAEPLNGVNPTAVIAAIKARASNRSAGRSVADGRRIGLVIEGGGMRGVCSGGSLVALEDLG